MPLTHASHITRGLAHGETPSDDGWARLYALFDRVAPRGSRLRSAVCAYLRPARCELASRSALYRWTGVAAFGRIIPTGGVDVRRLTGATMRPYTLRRASRAGARAFYYRACVFEALHLPFFLALVALALHRWSVGRVDHAIQESVINLVVNLLPMLHHRHTRARIVRLLSRRPEAVVPESSRIRVLIQAAAGSTERLRHDEATLELVGVGRVPRPYPHAYGFVLETTAPDGDNADCYVLGADGLKPGSVVSCEVVGLLEQLESGEPDHKLLARTAGHERELPDRVLEVLQDFIGGVFAEHPDVDVRVGPIRSRDEAMAYLRRCQRGE